MADFRKNDWVGLGWSLGIHVAVLLILSLMTVAASSTEPIGFIEVEFGSFAEGRPTPRVPEQRAEPVPETVAADEEETEQPATAPPEEVKPVELPDQAQDIPDEEVVDAPDAESISPEASNTEEEIPDPIPQPEQQTIKPLGSGSLEASDGDQTGDDGSGTDDTRSAPFQIEGLNRVPVSTSLPVYTEQVNALIRVRITVNPQGRIINRIPLIKGNPRLEEAVMEALARWRFNPLPSNAPRENQTGVISFRFTLR